MRGLTPVTVVLVLATVAGVAAAPPQRRFDFNATPGALSRTVIPLAYRIDLAPDLAALTFTANEAIDIEARAPTAAIVLNQLGLTLHSATLETGAHATIVEDQLREIATLTFAQPVAAGRHTLTISYGGPIRRSPNGLYLSDAKSADGRRRRVLATQFEPADARRLFPGWDEPAFKATFQLSVTLPAAFAAISNMPVANITPSGIGARHVVFAPSPRMSSYLLALVAGDIEAVGGGTTDATVAAWVPAGQQSRGQYGRDVARQVLPYYSGYFDIPYPLPKLDLVAVPGDYEAPGAMENAGAITFINGSMSFDAETSRTAAREDVFLTVAHEVAHQWAGDLVTMAWWDDLWLNEGIATWMQTKASDHFNPAWQTWPRQHRVRERVMAQDALPFAHPVRQPIADSFDAYLAFDDIGYDKAAEVIGMIEDWVGPETFRDGLRSYVKAHAFSSVTGADLWSALGQASGRDVAAVAVGFIERPGLPLVQVARRCEGDQASIILTQARFALREPRAAGPAWNIPVGFGGPGQPAGHVVLAGAPVTVPIAGCDAAIKLNPGERGYYRTQYDEASLKALAAALPELPPVDRANLLGDQFALFVAGRAALRDYLDLLDRLKDEPNIAVWDDTLAHLQKLDDLLLGSPEQSDFEAHAVALVRPAFDRLGWDASPSEPFVDALLRPKLIAALGQFGDVGIVAEANRRFAAFVAAPNSLSPDLRSAVLGIAGHRADQPTYNALRALAAGAGTKEDKARYLQAMAGAGDPTLIKQNLDFAASGEIQGARIVPFLIAASRASGKPDLLYALAVPVAQTLDARAHNDGFQPTALMAAATGSLNPEIVKDMLAARSSRSSRDARSTASRFADEIDANVELRRRTRREIAAWLAGRDAAGARSGVAGPLTPVLSETDHP